MKQNWCYNFHTKFQQNLHCFMGHQYG